MKSKKAAKKQKPVATYRVRKAPKMPVEVSPDPFVVKGSPSITETEASEAWPFATQMTLARWLAPSDATRPGLYLCQGQEGKGVALRLTLTVSGPNRQTLHWADETGSIVGDHCIKRVYGPVEEDE